jgi:hypothetical protein
MVLSNIFLIQNYFLSLILNETGSAAYFFGVTATRAHTQLISSRGKFPKKILVSSD